MDMRRPFLFLRSTCTSSPLEEAVQRGLQCSESNTKSYAVPCFTC